MRPDRKPWLRVVVLYAAGGLACGSLFLPLVPLVRMLGLPRDSSIGVSLYGLMPLLLVALGASCPRLLVNLVGLVLAILGYALGYAVGCRLAGSGSVAFNLVSMAPLVVPPYLVLVLLVYGLVRLRRRSGRAGAPSLRRPPRSIPTVGQREERT